MGLPTAGMLGWGRNDSGQIYYGQTQMYGEPKETEFRFSGASPVQLILAGNFWYNSRPVFKLQPNTRLTLSGNAGARDSVMASQDLEALSSALDDLRRLGEVDYRLSLSEPPASGDSPR